jgi:hypothetical protein
LAFGRCFGENAGLPLLKTIGMFCRTTPDLYFKQFLMQQIVTAMTNIAQLMIPK